MSTAGTVTGKGFVISYSVSATQNGYNNGNCQCRGGYTVTIDSSNVATCSSVSSSSNANTTTQSASGNHKFFTSKIALAFTTGTGYNSSGNSVSSTGSGNMKYILGS
jgi:hypothetical protein